MSDLEHCHFTFTFTCGEANCSSWAKQTISLYSKELTEGKQQVVSLFLQHLSFLSTEKTDKTFVDALLTTEG